jgi:hypothetical protein
MLCEHTAIFEEPEEKRKKEKKERKESPKSTRQKSTQIALRELAYTLNLFEQCIPFLFPFPPFFVSKQTTPNPRRIGDKGDRSAF